MQKIKTGDEIIVLIGKDKGKKGFVSKIVSDGLKAVVDGVNIVKKTQKPNPNLNIKGGIIDKEMPLDISNIAILNPSSNKADRVGFKLEGDKKVRFFKSDGSVITDKSYESKKKSSKK